MRRRFMLSVVVGVCGLLAVRAYAQASCAAPSDWRAPLIWACPDEPALATTYNRNLATVVAWLEAKVGTVDAGVVLPNGTVTSGMVVDRTITSTDLAASAVDTAALAANSVTSAKIASRISVYEVHGSCANAGLATFAATCTYASARCRTNCALSVDGYQACDGSCPPCLSQPAPLVCTANNPLRGYLVGP